MLERLTIRPAGLCGSTEATLRQSHDGEEVCLEDLPKDLDFTVAVVLSRRRRSRHPRGDIRVVDQDVELAVAVLRKRATSRWSRVESHRSEWPAFLIPSERSLSATAPVPLVAASDRQRSPIRRPRAVSRPIPLFAPVMNATLPRASHRTAPSFVSWTELKKNDRDGFPPGKYATSGQ
jgi:hypothetical protein